MNLMLRCCINGRKPELKSFFELLDKAIQNNATYVELFGSLFGNEKISESVIDDLFSTVRENSYIELCYKPYERNEVS